MADLTPGSRVRLRLRNHTLKAEATAEFIASEAGVVDVSAQAPVAGDYPPALVLYIEFFLRCARAQP